MIGYLKGKTLEIYKESLILLCGGVGYEVLLNNRNLSQLTKDEEVEFYIYTHVKEDQLKLYGFGSKLEKELFEAVISVSGVGPKIGLSILSVGEVGQIKKAISQADVNFFSKVKGLGKKRAQKIIIELKSKLGSLAELDLSGDETGNDNPVVEALISLGFRKSDILRVLEEMDSSLSESEKIRLGLQKLGK